MTVCLNDLDRALAEAVKNVEDAQTKLDLARREFATTLRHKRQIEAAISAAKEIVPEIN